jgi:Tfp pilus assembly protein PilF
MVQGYIRLQEGNPRDALEPLMECVQVTPNSFEGHKYLGETLEALGNIPAAIRSFRAAYQLNPNDEQCRARLEQLEQGISP